MDGKLTSLNEFLSSNRLFEIPIYQRGYAWEDENLRDLWDDVDYLGDRDHYFGTILLKKAEKKTRVGLRTFEHFDVIDGQQRLTTILILLRELISQLKDLGDADMSGEATRLEENYIVYQDHCKLTIGNEDRSFFHDAILAGRSATAPKTRAQERLRNAQTFFREQFERRREGQGRDEHLEFLIDFKSRIDRLQVMLYIVPSTAEAVRMFETVNDRGRPLTNLEKTKSILMYASYLVVGDRTRQDRTRLDTMLSGLNDDFSEIYRCFQDIEAVLKLRDAGEIQRYHHIFFMSGWNAHRHMTVLKDLLMSKSREDPKGCEPFIRRYSVSLRQAFQTMRDVANERRRERSELGRIIDRLFLVGRVGNLYPLLIASWQEFREDHQREEILRQFEAFVFRVYRVVRRRSNTGGSHMNWLAHQVHGGHLAFDDLVQELRSLTLEWASVDRFRQELSGTYCYGSLSTRTIKYLLAQYEEKLRRDAGERMTLPLADILSSEYETEHILPQHPAGGLDEKEMTAHQEIVHRLGNLTIASKQCNQIIGNRPFEEKRDGRGEPGYEKCCYRNSILHVQKNLAKYDEWNESTIQGRGSAIIDFAMERWRIDPTAGAEAKGSD